MSGQEHSQRHIQHSQWELRPPEDLARLSIKKAIFIRDIILMPEKGLKKRHRSLPPLVPPAENSNSPRLPALIEILPEMEIHHSINSHFSFPWQRNSSSHAS